MVYYCFTSITRAHTVVCPYYFIYTMWWLRVCVNSCIYTWTCSPISTCDRMCSCRGHRGICTRAPWHLLLVTMIAFLQTLNIYIYFSTLRAGRGSGGHYGISIKHVTLRYGGGSWPTKTLFQVLKDCVWETVALPDKFISRIVLDVILQETMYLEIQ